MIEGISQSFQLNFSRHSAGVTSDAAEFAAWLPAGLPPMWLGRRRPTLDDRCLCSFKVAARASAG